MADGIFKKTLKWLGIGAAAGVMAAGIPSTVQAQTADTIRVEQPANPTALSDSLQAQLMGYIKVIAKLKEQKDYVKAFEVTNDIKYSAKLIFQPARVDKDTTREKNALETLHNVIGEELEVLKAMFNDYIELKNGTYFAKAFDLINLVTYYSKIVSSESQKMGFKDQAKDAQRIGITGQTEYKKIEKLKYYQDMGVVDFVIKDMRGPDSAGRDKKFKKLVGMCSDKEAAKKKTEELLRATLKDAGANSNAPISYHFEDKKNGFWEIWGFVEVQTPEQAANLLK